MKVAFNFGFTLIPCDRCGSQSRAAGSSCPDCGAQGRKNEVNAQVAKRRQGVSAVRALVDASKSTSAPQDPYFSSRESWLGRLDAVLNRCLRSLERWVVDPLNPGRQAEAAAAIAELNRSSEEFNSIPELRPHVVELRERKRAVGFMQSAIDSYLESFCAGTPGSAQSLGRAAQLLLDQMDEAFEASRRPEALRQRFDDVGGHDFLRCAMQMLALENSSTLLAIDAEVGHYVSDLIGRDIAVGQGANYAVARVLAGAYLDPDRFQAAVATASQVIAEADGLGDLLAEHGAIEVLRRCRNAIVESTTSFAVAIESSRTDEARLRRIVSLYGELFEDGAAPLFAWYLRLRGARSAPVSTMIKSDSGDLLRSITSAPLLAEIFVGSDLRIRHAASHTLSYSLDGDVVRFALRSFEGELSVEVLIDTLFSLLESLLAAFWALDNELAAIGAEGHTVDMTLLGVSLLGFGELALGALGADIIDSSDAELGWCFRLSDEGRVDPFILATALAGNPPAGVQYVRIEYPHLPAGSLHVTVAAKERFRAFKELEGLSIISENLEFLVAATVDEEPALTVEHLQATANVAALALLDKDDRAAISLLRRCLVLARQLRADDVVELVEGVFSEWRSPTPGRIDRLKRKMREWVELPAPALPQVRYTTVDV